MTLVETIEKVAKYAYAGKNTLNTQYLRVHFLPGEVYAGQSHLAVRAPLGTEICASVNAKALQRALKAARGDVELVKDGPMLVMTSGKMTVKLPIERGDFTLPRPPKAAQWVEVEIPAISRNAWSICSMEDRPHLAGIHFDERGVTSTNGHTLVHQAIGVDYTQILGAATTIQADALAGLPDQVWVCREGNMVFLATDAAGEHYRAINALPSVFPSYGQLIDPVFKDFGHVEVDRGAFLDLIRRARLAADHVVRIQIEGSVLIAEVDVRKLEPLFGFTDQVELQNRTEKVADMTTGFDVSYLISMLEAIPGETVRLYTRKDLDAVGFESEDRTVSGVVMPSRL